MSLNKLLNISSVACLASFATQGQALKTGQNDPASVTTTPAATTTAATSQSTGSTCKEQVKDAFKPGDATDTQFLTFVNEVCPSLDLRVPNGVKVSSCFHTGFFLQKSLQPIADRVAAAGADLLEAEQELDMYVDDFCASYGAVLPMRTEMVKAIYQIDDLSTFTDSCFDFLQNTPTLNTWFDPIDPLSSITQQEICDLHFKLFQSLKDKQRTSISEFVSFSYLASLDLFLNAYEQEDYENCVNMDVVTDPNQWATTFTTAHPAFHVWDNASKLDVAANTGGAITSSCADSVTCATTGQCISCDGCATGISRIYKTFEVYMNKLFADTFKAHSESMFNKLHEANLAMESV